ncbi:MAG: ABC-F type ribosomal protection protein [Clostridiales bacterium]|nr:ABC-F type ribosomal protection protein [Clostridiales bacterium]
MSQILVNDLTFHYEGSYDNVFSHMSFSIDTGWKLGFVGRNGRGKTTFLKLLMGEYAYEGTISSSVAFDYFPFAVADASLTTEAVYESIADAPRWRLEKELNLLEVDPGVLERAFSTLSPGEQTKVLLAALFSREGRFLLIDEPTNHLDMEARAVVSRYLGGKRGFILVSHDRAFLDGCVDHILSINRASIEVQKGNFSSWEKNRRRQDNFERAENERLTQEIGELRAAARRTAEWSDRLERTKIGEGVVEGRADRGTIGAQSARVMKRAKSAERRQENAAKEKEKLLKDIERNDTLKITPLRHYADVLAEADGLSIAYGPRTVCGPLDFVLRQGERVALTGRNGSGKSSVVRLLAGEPVPHTGTLRLASGLVVSYMPQDTSFLSGTVLDYARSCGLDETLFLTILRKLDFPRVQFEKDMRSFSGGQKKKALLAKTLSEQAHLYVWDEPLNFVDVLSRLQVRDLLLAAKPTMLFVEHDRAFVDEIATRIIPL